MKTHLAIVLLFLIANTVAFQPESMRFDSLSPEQTHRLPTFDSNPPPQPERQLLSITRNPLRITLDTSTFNTVTAGATGTTTVNNLAFIKRAMLVAQNFFQVRLKVYPLSTLKAPGTCVDYTPSQNDQLYGISATDLHIYVLYITDSGQSYGATGGSCLYFNSGGTYPDATLQIGRPTMGRIIFNTHNLVDQLASLTNFVFQSVTSTALHQTMHILGFDSTKFSTWLVSVEGDARFGNVYASTTSSGAGTISASRPSTTYLTTPNVQTWARTFFNCPTLIGMVLQNEDGTGLGAGSHWQRTAMYDQLMTATSLGTTVKYFSGLTFAALKDMGWYTVDDTFNQTSNYGYQRGCSFVLDACYSASVSSFTQFCNAATLSGVSSCQTSFFGKAICTTDAAAMADSCGIFGPYSNCVDPTTTDSGYASYTQQQYATNSYCIASTLGTVPLPATLTSRCYPYVCGVNTIVFTVGTYTITCLSTEAGVQKTLSSMTGHLTCPIFADFCTNSRKTCSNWCSQNGYCMAGVCNCLQGYYGVDCSQTMCSIGTYFDSTTSTCVSVCPSGYYQNIYSHSCEACDSTCQECFGEPTICTGCISTAQNPQYFYNNTCYSACPSGTFADGFNCTVCDSVTAYCLTCSILATNCTSCGTAANGSQMYLHQPVYGNCIASCPTVGSFTLTDVVNNGCVGTCANNLVLTGTQCTYCPSGGYKLISNSSCLTSCPQFFYPDTTLFLCSQCDPSCLTCSGQYAQNCTSCSSTNTLRYLLLQMCWSICPGGYYANDTANTCFICPTDINCGNCTYSNSTGAVICTSCAYGFFFQSSTSTCASSCNSTEYANKGNNTCISCNAGCLTCNGPDNSTCASCTSSLFLMQNITGAYCVAACNPVGYVQSGTSCLACDVSCYTCSGTANNQCTSCTNGSYLSSSLCRLVCPPATWPNTTTHTCDACDGSCTFCFGSTINNCTGCITGMVLFNFTCTISCPTGYTVNQWNVCHQPYLYLYYAFTMLLMLGLL